jgi:hypothetical protein
MRYRIAGILLKKITAMKKQAILLSVILLLTGTAALAQVKISVVAGPGFTSFMGSDAEDWGSVGEKPKMVVRFHGGVVVNYPLNEKLSAISGIQYSMKGTAYSGEIDIGEGGSFTAEYKKVLTYLDIPLSVQYAVSDRVALQAGTQVSILTSAKVKNSKEVQDNFQLPATEDAKDYYSTLDMGFIVGPVFRLSEKLSVQLLYRHGLLKIAKAEEYNVDTSNFEEVKKKVMNQGFTLSLVYVVKE